MKGTPGQGSGMKPARPDKGCGGYNTGIDRKLLSQHVDKDKRLLRPARSAREMTWNAALVHVMRPGNFGLRAGGRKSP